MVGRRRRKKWIDFITGVGCLDCGHVLMPGGGKEGKHEGKGRKEGRKADGDLKNFHAAITLHLNHSDASICSKNTVQ